MQAEAFLKSKKVLNEEYRPVYLNFKVYFPIKKKISEIEKINGYVERVNEDFFPRKPRRVYSLSELEKLYNIQLPKSVSILGDIILLNEIPDKADEKTVGEIIRSNFGARAVFLKIKETSGDFRIANWKLIAGFGDTFTVHHENNFYFALDPSKVFFNPRMGSERNRVINATNSNETVLDMFAGVGPFSLPIAKKCAKVFAIDINPNAVQFMKINLKLNKVPAEKISILCGDAAKIAPKLERKADRVIMNYPEKAIDFITHAIQSIKLEGGIIHLYTFIRAKNKKNAIYLAKKELDNKIRNHVQTYKILWTGASREVAPRKYMVILDILMKPKFIN